jgi:hypothetical protein
MARDLLGEAAETGSGLAKVSESPVVRCEEAFKAAFEVRFGFKPRIAFGRDRKHLKDMVQAWGEPEVVKLIGQFFASRDPKVAAGWDADYGVAHFSRVAQYLKIGGANGRLSAKTAANAETVARVLKGNK